MVTVDLMCAGFPGKSPTHGGMGWASQLLIRAEGKNILCDTGGPNTHSLLLKRLAERGLSRGDIDIVILSHSHWDHSLGFPLFSDAEIVIGEAELEWALGLKPGEKPSVPAFLMRHLADHPRLRTIRGDTELLPGITMIDTPGHTPGHMSLLATTDQGKVAIVQDAIKNRAEFLARRADSTMDAAATAASIDKAASLASTIIPGHDRPFRIEEGRAVYLGEMRVEIAARISPIMEEQTVFSLVFR